MTTSSFNTVPPHPPKTLGLTWLNEHAAIHLDLKTPAGGGGGGVGGGVIQISSDRDIEDFLGLKFSFLNFFLVGKFEGTEIWRGIF